MTIISIGTLDQLHLHRSNSYYMRYPTPPNYPAPISQAATPPASLFILCPPSSPTLVLDFTATEPDKLSGPKTCPYDLLCLYRPERLLYLLRPPSGCGVNKKMHPLNKYCSVLCQEMHPFNTSVYGTERCSPVTWHVCLYQCLLSHRPYVELNSERLLQITRHHVQQPVGG